MPDNNRRSLSLAVVAVLLFATWAGYVGWQVSVLRTTVEVTVGQMRVLGKVGRELRHLKPDQRQRVDALHTKVSNLQHTMGGDDAAARERMQSTVAALQALRDEPVDDAQWLRKQALAMDLVDQSVGALRAATGQISIALGRYWTALYIVLVLSIVLGVINIWQLSASHRIQRQLAREVAQRKSAEEALKQRNDELSAVNRELNAFAGAAAHDLKEPLASIQQCITFLQDDLAPDVATHEEMLGYIHDSAQRLDRLVTGLLAYAQAGAGTDTNKQVDLTDALADARSNLATQIASTRTTIIAPQLPKVLGDRGQLTMLLQNALSNAIKFRSESPPRIEIELQTTDDAYVIGVKDNGIGVNEADAERIFDAFVRAENGRERPGSGIGLSTCKRIVDNHGGRIWLASNGGQGSTFTFTLPRMHHD